jgi:hypothetical protein
MFHGERGDCRKRSAGGRAQRLSCGQAGQLPDPMQGGTDQTMGRPRSVNPDIPVRAARSVQRSPHWTKSRRLGDDVDRLMLRAVGLGMRSGRLPGPIPGPGCRSGIREQCPQPDGSWLAQTCQSVHIFWPEAHPANPRLRTTGQTCRVGVRGGTGVPSESRTSSPPRRLAREVGWG